MQRYHVFTNELLVNQYRSRWATVRGPLLRGGELSTLVFIRGGQLSAFGGHLAGGQLSGGQLSALPLVGICPVGNCPRFRIATSFAILTPNTCSDFPAN